MRLKKVSPFMVILLLIFGFNRISVGVNKNIDLAEKNFKLPVYFYESDKPTAHFISADYNTSFLWNSRQGFDLRYIWQPGVVGFTIGYSTGQAAWGDLQVVACSLCGYSDPTASMSPDSEILKVRATSDQFRFGIYHLGLNYMSHLLRRDAPIFWQMRGEILYGKMTEEQYLTAFDFQGASLGSFLTFALNQSQSFYFNVGYSQRLGILESKGDLSRFERMLYIQFGQLQIGLSKRL